MLDAAAQGSEFLVTSSNRWWVQVYGLNEKNNDPLFDLESTDISDSALNPDANRSPLWCSASRELCGEYGSVTFIAPDVIGCAEVHAQGVVSTWCVHTGECLENATFRSVNFNFNMSKISDTEFVLGSKEGHLCFVAHGGGRNLRESARVWKAHSRRVRYVAVHQKIVATASSDCSVRVWDAKTQQRLAVLNHDNEVCHTAISDKYIATCSSRSHDPSMMGELRIYRNGEGYPLQKIVRSRELLSHPIFIGNDRILCLLRGELDEDYLPLVRDSLGVVDIESERVLARLKVACRSLLSYAVLGDVRLAMVGRIGSCGVIATPPRRVRKLIAANRVQNSNRGMCSLM